MNWVSYVNGNYIVKLNLDDGTKIRISEDDTFIPSFAESCDVLLTQKCQNNCGFCYAGCTPAGKHADLLSQKWVDTLHPYTEMALNGNDLDHPQLVPFLNKLKEKKVVPNITVHQNQFMNNLKLIKDLYADKLIYGIGVSYSYYDENFIKEVLSLPTAILHVINGIFSEKDINSLADKGLKILILGYKDIGRGVSYKDNYNSEIKNNQKYLYINLKEVLKRFEVVSFDNLAISQLNVRRLFTRKGWDEFYMGNDGTSTFYIDMVNNKFAQSSTTLLTYPIMDNIDDMFNFIRNAE